MLKQRIITALILLPIALGGFFLLDCASLDEAVAIAARCPAAEWATVEVREFGPCFT